MKALVFLLVLGNLLLYALGNGLLGNADNPDALRIDQQIAVDRIKLVSRGEAPANKPNPPASDKSSETCMRWEQLAINDADQLEIFIKEKFPDLKAKRQTLAGEGSSWWVFIPPLPGKAEADKKAGELRQLGITDYFIIQDNSSNRFAVSLGVFSSEKGGQERLAELKAKNVKSARLVIRPGKDTQVNMEASGALPDKAEFTEQIAAFLPKNPPLNCK